MRRNRDASFVEAGETRIRLPFDGWSDNYDYEDRTSFEGFRPVGWVASQPDEDFTLQGVIPPGEGGSWPDPFDWGSYLESASAEAAPPQLLPACTARDA